jgi:hypothetical protein
MTDTMLISGVANVAIPVTDQDRSKALLESIGFATVRDAELAEGFRWVEMAPPGSATAISLVLTGDGLPCGIDTGIRLVAPDARAAHAALSAQGLDVGELLDWETAPLMFTFTDLDGNRLYVMEPS